MNKNNLSEEIRKIFIKYDLIGVIDKGFPSDEYQMEEAKIYKYIINNEIISKSDLFEEMKNIMIEWLGEKIVCDEKGTFLLELHNMSDEIYQYIVNGK